MVKTITINDQAYLALASQKRSTKDSFSKVILRMTGESKSVKSVAGAWKHKSLEECNRIIGRSREMFDEIGKGD